MDPQILAMGSGDAKHPPILGGLDFRGSPDAAGVGALSRDGAPYARRRLGRDALAVLVTRCRALHEEIDGLVDTVSKREMDSFLQDQLDEVVPDLIQSLKTLGLVLKSAGSSGGFSGAGTTEPPAVAARPSKRTP